MYCSTHRASRTLLALVALSFLTVAGCRRPAHEAPSPRTILPGKPLYSSHNEELLIRSFFNDRRDGVFLDVGCYLPIRSSNTYYLEKHLGWSGIAVDALAEFAPAWKETRPRSKFFAFLVSDHSHETEAFYRSQLRDVSSTERERVARRKKRGKTVEFEQIQVPTITLTKLLDDNGLSKVDLVSLDIEGGEPLALAGFDIERFRPELVCLEVSWKTRESVRAYFAKHGFDLIQEYLAHDPHNEYFTPKSPRPGAR